MWPSLRNHKRSVMPVMSMTSSIKCYAIYCVLTYHHDVTAYISPPLHVDKPVDNREINEVINRKINCLINSKYHEFCEGIYKFIS